MDLFEFENQQFPNTWDKETIKEVRKSEPHKISTTEINTPGEEYEEWIMEYHEANQLN